MNNNILLSIIIPAYNVESYIGRCIESCLSQDLPHEVYEIIIVDDGSSDGTAQAIRAYQNVHTNISYFHQDNSGQGAARNKGLECAVGKYVWFIDSDDWIKENCLRSLIDFMEARMLDFCLFPIAKVSKEGEFIEDDFKNFGDNIYSLSDFAKEGKMTFTPWNYIFLRELATSNNVSFLTGIFHEDVEFNTRLLLNTQRIAHYDLNRALYYYRFTRNGSTMNSKSKKSIEKHIFSLFTVLKHIRNTYRIAEEPYKSFLATMHNSLFFTGLLPLFKQVDWTNKEVIYREYIDETDFHYLVPVQSPMKPKLLAPFRRSLSTTYFLQNALSKL